MWDIHFLVPGGFCGLRDHSGNYSKVNHVVYIVPRWYESRIYADCQQNLFFIGA